jgi:hypothetical protein
MTTCTLQCNSGFTWRTSMLIPYAGLRSGGRFWAAGRRRLRRQLLLHLRQIRFHVHLQAGHTARVSCFPEPGLRCMAALQHLGQSLPCGAVP